MRHLEHHCIQCGTPYWYQACGHGAPETNDKSYCPKCFSLILKALKKVVKKYEWRYKDASHEITLTELLEHQKIEEAKIQKSPLIASRRVYPGLFCTKYSEASSSCDIVVGDKTYHLMTWPTIPEYSISRRVYWNIKENKPHDPKETAIHQIKTLVIEGAEYPPEKPMEIKQVTLMTGPVGLASAMRYADPRELWNKEIEIVLRGNNDPSP